MLNTILGGSFTSRLNQNLREEHGYTYGASSRFDMRARAGPFFAAAGVQTDKTAEALKEFFNELTRIHEAGARPTSSTKAKNYVALLLPAQLRDDRRHLASALDAGVRLQPARRLLRDVRRRIQAVTAADVQRVAEKYIQPDKFAVVVVGDRKDDRARRPGAELGPITVVEPAEVMK